MLIASSAPWPCTKWVTFSQQTTLLFLLALARNDFDSIRLDCMGIIQLKIDVFDDECPDLVTESVGVKMSLQQSVSSMPALVYRVL